MANNFLKADQIAAAAIGLLQREMVLPGLVWTNAVADFRGARDDTVSLRVPARAVARERTLRDNSGLVMDELAETKVDVTLDKDVYHGAIVTDENLNLDISNFGAQVLQPQVSAVALGVENRLATLMSGATYANTISVGSSDAYEVLVDARAALQKAFVPRENRVVVVGADLEAKFLKSERLSRVDQSGSDSALRDANIGRIAGMPVYASMAIDPGAGYVFHKSAFVLSMMAPTVPDGCTYGKSQSYQGIALRWIRDYDPIHTTDRSIVSTWIGANVVADGPGTNEVQTVSVTGSPTGGTFTLTYGGQTTSGIAYNASPSAVASALNGLSSIPSGGVTVTGSAGSYTVTFKNGQNVPTLTATPSLTGGSSPSVNVSTSTAGGGTSFVRAVKLTA